MTVEQMEIAHECFAHEIRKTIRSWGTQVDYETRRTEKSEERFFTGTLADAVAIDVWKGTDNAGCDVLLIDVFPEEDRIMCEQPWETHRITPRDFAEMQQEILLAQFR